MYYLTSGHCKASQQADLPCTCWKCLLLFPSKFSFTELVAKQMELWGLKFSGNVQAEWNWWSVAGLSPRRFAFHPGTVHVRVVVDKVTLGEVYLRILVSPVGIIPPLLHAHLFVTDATALVVSVVKKHMHTSHVTSWEQRTSLSISMCSVLQGSSWQTLVTTCGWPMLVAIPTPENMCHLILRNPGSGNTGNDGDGNGTLLEAGSSVAHTLTFKNCASYI
jgi:hypothetical protein